MKAAVLSSLILLSAVAAGLALETSPDPAKLQELYNKAFNDYRAGKYSLALKAWNDVLRLDPAQVTARKMVRQARQIISRNNRRRLDRVARFVGEGHYAKALVEMQSLIEEDESHPRFKELEGRIEEVASIAPEEPEPSKAWRMARRGLEGVLGSEEDAQLAYNGLRYAAELDPKDERFKRLLDWLLTRHRDLAGKDLVTPGMTWIDYKQFIALNAVYDGKYNVAVDILNEILTLEPDNLLALKRLGSAYFYLGNKERARKAWRQAMVLAPQDPQLKKFLSKLDATDKTKP